MPDDLEQRTKALEAALKQALAQWQSYANEQRFGQSDPHWFIEDSDDPHDVEATMYQAHVRLLKNADA